MNFLAHAWTLGRKEPELVLGAALPDLVGVFDRTLPRLGALEALGADPIARGVRAHHAADSAFHELAAFKEGCKALRASLGALRLERVRGFFLAHLLVEVLLDAALMEEDERLLHDFYSSLEAAPIERAAAVLPEGFERFFERFVRARFVGDYATDAGVVYRLEQVLSRARQTLGTDGKRDLEAALPELRALVRTWRPALTEEPSRAARAALL